MLTFFMAILPMLRQVKSKKGKRSPCITITFYLLPFYLAILVSLLPFYFLLGLTDPPFNGIPLHFQYLSNAGKWGQRRGLLEGGKGCAFT
jgi:hypothetical protein